MEEKRSLGWTLGLIASCIAIFVFLTGWQSIWDVIKGILGFSVPPFAVTQSSPPIQITASPIITPSEPPVLPANWKSLGLIGEPIVDISTSQGVIYLATLSAKHGIFKSEDLGLSWHAINNGLENLNVFQVEVSPQNSNLVYSVDGSLWRSEDGGATWFNANPDEVCGNMRGVALGSEDGLKVYWKYCFAGFAISTDSGKSWTDKGGIEGWYGNMMRSAPSDRSIVYSFTAVYEHSVDPGSHSPEVQRYSNGKWLQVAHVGTGQNIFDLAVSYKDPSLLFVGTPNGIYRSIDAGGSWTPMNNTLPEQGNNLSCTSVQTSSWNDTEVFAVCNGNIYKSDDLGENWSLLNSPDEVRLVHVMTEPKILLAVTSNKGLFSYSMP